MTDQQAIAIMAAILASDLEYSSAIKTAEHLFKAAGDTETAQNSQTARDKRIADLMEQSAALKAKTRP